MKNAKTIISYTGRFAPSPSGPLHFGSMLTALASYLDAKSNQGLWLLRIDDIDPPRTLPGATSDIQRTLASLGLEWDGPVIYQSHRAQSYQEVLEQLTQADALFYCQCTRAQLRHIARYPGTCRDHKNPRTDAAIRITMPPTQLHFEDDIQGLCVCPPEEISDWIIKRKDGYWAYQFATALDDTQDGISHVVRGIDLMTSTYRQIWLQQLLGKQTPQYAHLPVVLGDDGKKLSKQNWAKPIADYDVVSCFTEAFRLLKLPTMPDMDQKDWLTWAISEWDIHRLKGIQSLAMPFAPDHRVRSA